MKSSTLFPGCTELPDEWTSSIGLTVANDEQQTFPLNQGDTVCLSCSDKNLVLVGDKCPTCDVYMPWNFNFTSEPSCHSRGSAGMYSTLCTRASSVCY